MFIAASYSWFCGDGRGNNRPRVPFFAVSQQLGRVSSLSELVATEEGTDWALGILDAGTDALHPGWTLRNALALIGIHFITIPGRREPLHTH